MIESRKKPVSPILKLVLEVGPLAVFFLTFQFGEDVLANPMLFSGLEMVTGAEVLSGKDGRLYVATASFMVAIALSLSVSWFLMRTLPKMAVVTAIVVAVFGGLTLWLQDKTFIMMKPTIVNGIFALTLGFGLLQGRSYLKYLMGDALPLTDEGWMIFTQRWVLFFIFLAILNEVIWRNFDEDFWVGFKTFANPVISFLFVALQWKFLQRHTIEEPPSPARLD